MGEAKKRRRKHAEILENYPNCIYCGGVIKATQVDHMPPRVMFRMNQRPKGFEFPSCAGCNQGTSKADLVAAYFSRSYPGIQNKADEAEWERLVKSIKNNVKGLLEEMLIPEWDVCQYLQRHGLGRDYAVFFASGPIAFTHMTAFGAKAALATYFEVNGHPLSASGRVQVRWFTSEEMIENKVPETFYSSLGQFQYLKQGKITSEYEFEYSVGTYKPNVNLFGFTAREAFVIAGFVVENEIDLPFPTDELATFKPGDLSKELIDRGPKTITKREFIKSLYQ